MMNLDDLCLKIKHWAIVDSRSLPKIQRICKKACGAMLPCAEVSVQPA